MLPQEPLFWSWGGVSTLNGFNDICPRPAPYWMDPGPHTRNPQLEPTTASAMMLILTVYQLHAATAIVGI